MIFCLESSFLSKSTLFSQIGGSNAITRYYLCPMCEIDVEDYGMMQFHFHTEAHVNGFKMLQEALEA